MKIKCPRCGYKGEVLNNKCLVCELPLESNPSKPFNKKIYKVAILVIMVLVIGFAYLYWSNPSITQAGKDAYKAIKNIEALTASGVNFQNYSAAVSNATLEYEMYADGKGKKNEKFLHLLGKALTAYQYSKDIWNKEIFSKDEMYEKFLLSKEELGKYAQLFPALYEAEKRGKKLMEEKGRNVRDIVGENHTTAFRVTAKMDLWLEASKELKKARSIID